LVKQAAEEISKLLYLKAKSIELEDYDLAEEAKTDISRIKNALETKIHELDLKLTPDGRIVPSDWQDSVSPQKYLSTPDVTIDVSKDALEKLNRDLPDLSDMPNVLLPAVPETVLEPELNLTEIKREQVEEMANPRSSPSESSPSAPNPKQNATTNTDLALTEMDHIESPVRPRKKMPAKPSLSKTSVKQTIGHKSSVVADAVQDPEKLSDDQAEKFAQMIQVYGPFTASCILSKRFNLRELALEDVITRLEAWKSNNNSKKKDRKRDHSRAQTKSCAVSDSESIVGNENLDTISGTASSEIEKTRISHSGRKHVEEVIRIDWRTVAPAPKVDRETFIGATFMVIHQGLEDNREKPFLTTLKLWEILTKACATRGVSKAFAFQYLEELIPSLLTKCGHLSARIKQGSLDLIALLAKAYHVIPYSVGKFILKYPKANSPPRHIVGRLDALHIVLMKIGVDDTKQIDHAGSGITIKTAIGFAEHQLHHKIVEVREAAANVVVALCILTDNDELIFSYLLGVKHQLMHIIQTKLDLARHGLELKETEKGPVDPTMNDEQEEALRNPLVEELSKFQGEFDIGGDQLSVAQQAPIDSEPSGNPLIEPVNPSEPVKSTAQESAMVESQEKSTVSHTTENDTTAKSVTAEIAAGTDLVQSLHREIEALKDLVQTQLSIVDRTGSKSPDPSLTPNVSVMPRVAPEMVPQAAPQTRNLETARQLSDVDSGKRLVPGLKHKKECESKNLVKICARCKEAVLVTEFDRHVERRTCQPASILPGVSRCPICHKDVPHGESGWKNHLLRGGKCKPTEQEALTQVAPALVVDKPVDEESLPKLPSSAPSIIGEQTRKDYHEYAASADEIDKALPVAGNNDVEESKTNAPVARGTAIQAVTATRPPKAAKKVEKGAKIKTKVVKK
ncbi:hypothetical protein HDU82_005544, partial [Entophlyctis luteolus]